MGGGSVTTAVAHPGSSTTSTSGVVPAPSTSPEPAPTSSTFTVSTAPGSTTTKPPAPTTTTPPPTTTKPPAPTTTTPPPTTTKPPAPTTTTPPPTTTTTVASSHPDTGDVAGFEVVNARLGNRSLLLAVADTTPLRSRGLMGVRTLGDLDGMVFTWDQPQSVSFWMKNTLIPLEIGYFDEDASLFLVLSMVPCAADPCPTYPSESPIRYALEAIPGFFDDIPVGESLTLGETVSSP